VGGRCALGAGIGSGAGTAEVARSGGVAAAGAGVVGGPSGDAGGKGGIVAERGRGDGSAGRIPKLAGSGALLGAETVGPASGATSLGARLGASGGPPALATPWPSPAELAARAAGAPGAPVGAVAGRGDGNGDGGNGDGDGGDGVASSGALRAPIAGMPITVFAGGRGPVGAGVPLAVDERGSGAAGGAAAAWGGAASGAGPAPVAGRGEGGAPGVVLSRGGTALGPVAVADEVASDVGEPLPAGVAALPLGSAEVAEGGLAGSDVSLLGSSATAAPAGHYPPKALNATRRRCVDRCDAAPPTEPGSAAWETRYNAHMAYLWLRSGHSGQRVITALILSIFVAAQAACGDESGVLVQVRRDPSSTPATIDTLKFVIGLDDGSGTFMMEPNRAITSIDVTGRDLDADPYQLLLHNGSGRGGARVTVAVFAYQAGQQVGFAGFAEPQAFQAGQVLMRELTLAGEPDVEVTDTGCVRWAAGPADVVITVANDEDCDNDDAAVDCNDKNPAIGPSQTEICDNDIDDNCKDGPDEVTNVDGDAFTNCMMDCDDNDKDTYPGAPEKCDKKDNDCNKRCDDANLDKDNDNYNTCGEKIRGDGSCVAAVVDCNDDNQSINPAAMETCDGQDNDCNQVCDDAAVTDPDGDGFTACGTVPGRCMDPLSGLIDCMNDRKDVHPFADEICDGFDTDCDGSRLDHAPCYGAPAASGECRVGARECDDDNSDGSAGWKGACEVADGDPPAPPVLCSAYGTCDAMMSPNPFACASAKVANGKIQCSLLYTGLNTLCPERNVALPVSPNATGCLWAIVGGQDQEHYKVGLATSGGSPQPVVDTCAAFFGVIQAKDLFLQPDQVFLAFTSDQLKQTQTLSLTRLEITPMNVAACPPSPGLVCTVVSPPFSTMTGP
jgi:hypothetical protein